MQREMEFRRRLESSRRFVFENIMDLDHVCVVHRRWFRDLRVVAVRDGYVEYRLKAVFHGIPQRMDVRGWAVDANRYGYEFLGPLMSVRVDGSMEGPDGDLLLIERITYRFPWVLAPLFPLLLPLLRKQKEDILRDDTRLLERVYRLDREGFRRFAG